MWSEEVFRIHGVPVEAVPPTRDEAIALYHPDDHDVIRRNLVDAVGSRDRYEGQYRVLRPGGDVRHVLTRGRCEIDPETGEVNGLFGVIIDVTELTRSQRELGEATAHLRATLDNMDQGLMQGRARRHDRAVQSTLRRTPGPAADLARWPGTQVRRCRASSRGARRRRSVALSPGPAERIADPGRLRARTSERSDPGDQDDARSPEAAWSGPTPTSRRGAEPKTPFGTARRSTGCWPIRRAT